MDTRRGCYCKSNLTCWWCVEDRRWERVFQARHGAAERDYYRQRRDPRQMRCRSWYGGQDDEARATDSIDLGWDGMVPSLA